jgi:NitT/TauT family transport system ATP-binding protein
VLLSRRPGRVRAVLPVPLPRPRDEAMQASPAFVAFTREIWGMVKDEARAAMMGESA